MTIRLYIGEPLSLKRRVWLTSKQSHYLVNVMRSKVGDGIILFNGIDGEWSGTLLKAPTEGYAVTLNKKIKLQLTEPNIKLAFALIKKTPLNFIIEKSTELGVSEIFFLITERTIVSRVNINRIRENAQKAAEQCGRLTIPTISKPINIKSFLSSWNKSIPVLLMDETGQGTSINQVLLKQKMPITILIGPEGGFTDSEQKVFRSLHFVKAVTLGPRILRAETAAISAIACCQATIGDWTQNQSKLI